MAAKWLVLGGLNALVAVAAGAFGAHYLKTRLNSNDLAAFEVAVRYQMYHALVMVVVAGLRPSYDAAGWCFLGGTVLFSGSLYGLALGGWRGLGPITPIGGLLLLTGWFLLIVHGISVMRTPTAG
jgi:uncharacterized membrane protein YgdD (TMEM256/DUF423 family)